MMEARRLQLVNHRDPLTYSLPALVTIEAGLLAAFSGTLPSLKKRTGYPTVTGHPRPDPRIRDPKEKELLVPSEPPYYIGTKRRSLEQDYYECCDQPHIETELLHTLT